MERRGAELVDFKCIRVRPRTLFDIAGGFAIPTGRRIGVDLQLVLSSRDALTKVGANFSPLPVRP